MGGSVRCATEPSAADHGVGLNLYEPPRIEEPLDDDEARGLSDPAEGLAVNLRDSVTVSRIHEEHPRAHYVTKCRADLDTGGPRRLDHNRCCPSGAPAAEAPLVRGANGRSGVSACT